MPIPTLKRRLASEDDEIADQPTKLPAIGVQRPQRPTIVRSLASSSKPSTLAAPTIPLQPIHASNATKSSRQRTTSAPSKSTAVLTNSRVANKATARRVGGPTSRTDDPKFEKLQEQVRNLEDARLRDAEKLALEMDSERAKVSELQNGHVLLTKQLEQSREQELNHKRELLSNSDAMDALKKTHAREVMEMDLSLTRKDREIRELSEDVRCLRLDLQRERGSVQDLRSNVAQMNATHLTLTSANAALQAQNSAFQAQLDVTRASGLDTGLRLESALRKIAQLEQEARDDETLRRKLHNTIQELKGNIRVFCRVRPVLLSDAKRESASIAYPDSKEHREIMLQSTSESAMGNERQESWSFAFDHIFQPGSTQAEVFEEISLLVQSCADGYNVCIFAYGQTGSGKSFTMEGPSSLGENVGMIPRAVEKVFDVVEGLRNKGWEYQIEGQFLEIYNETINDLLGKGEFDKKKHDIRHESGRTRVTDVVVLPLDSPSKVRSLLSFAQSRRSVAATLMNERSSRSHSVFTLRLTGTNSLTGESCEGNLNLVDLAGSERLSASGSGNDRDRLKETQAINRSLSALGDVIGALGEKGEKVDKHVPYRNSKLTYLLQNSLSGNSKTLMILNLSPLAAHLNESLCSLRFATKVNNTTLGTARKQHHVAS